jgi:hypothetical protein
MHLSKFVLRMFQLWNCKKKKLTEQRHKQHKMHNKAYIIVIAYFVRTHFSYSRQQISWIKCRLPGE